MDTGEGSSKPCSGNLHSHFGCPCTPLALLQLQWALATTGSTCRTRGRPRRLCHSKAENGGAFSRNGLEVSHRPLDGAECSRRRHLRRSTMSRSKVAVAEAINSSVQAPCWYQELRRRCWRTAAIPFLDKTSLRGGPNWGYFSASFVMMSRRVGLAGQGECREGLGTWPR